MKIDLSLNNKELYNGCTIEEVNGRKNLSTMVEEAASTIGRNIEKISIDPEEVVLSGAMAIWAYLIVFHSVVHKTKSVFYDDGHGTKILISKHG